MKPLREVIESVMAGEAPAYDDLFYTVCVLHNLLTFDGADLAIATEGGSVVAARLLEEHRRRLQAALSKVPRTWLGDEDPRDPEFQEYRQEALAIRHRNLH